MISTICASASVRSSIRVTALFLKPKLSRIFCAFSLVALLLRKIPFVSSRFRKILSAIDRCGSGFSSWCIIEIPFAIASAGPLAL